MFLVLAQGQSRVSFWVLEFQQRKVARGVPEGALGVLRGTLGAPEDVFLGFCCECSNAIGVWEVIGNI